ncbi:MAG: S41 family peptidase [Magnetovibrio sp.]|nr:S41 family peptidase [Magnetovibrio sp.]
MLAAVLLIAGCAVAPPKPERAADTMRHEEVFAAGFNSIVEKYIDPVAIDDIALGGLQGFASIDPALRVRRAGGRVIMEYDGDRIAEAPAPATDAPRGWAKLTASFSSTARHSSSLMGKASDEKIYEAVFDGVLSDLDVFSRYAGAEEARRNRARREGFGGIGIRFKLKNGDPVITEVMPETPAARAGLKVGDVIVRVGETNVRKFKLKQIVAKLRGPTHSKVHVRLYRATEDRHVEAVMERLHIVPPTVKASIEAGVLYIKVSSFNQATARGVAAELEKAKTDAAGTLRGVVLDLRGNPGGLLKQSVKMADLLLTHGHIVSTRGRHPDSLHHYEAGGRDLADGKPVVVLVDGKSASASEIVAAALQDRERAVLIGTSSFGKGTVQTVIRLPNNGEITLTWSRLMAPSGYALHGIGVRPEICTSGTPKNLKAEVRKILAARLQTKKTFASWRSTSFREKSARKELRKTCPSARHKTDLDLQMARILLDDEQLFSQALDLSSTTVQARK